MLRIVIIICVLWVILSCDNTTDQSPISPQTASPVPQLNDNTPQRVVDLTTIVYALEKYKRDHNSYPISGGSGREWNSVYNNSDGDTNHWIPGLSPKYLATLPRDPRKSESHYPQYLYKSNGAHYKLISRNPPDCKEVKSLYPNLIDPKRDCRAYGFWTPKAAGW